MDAYSLIVLNVVGKARPPQMDARAEDSYYARHAGYSAPQNGLAASLAVAVLTMWWLLVGAPFP